ncbi:UV radiation resistance protein and autophagy-related subunit 14-domain-containing protein [Pseudomassariella vexata]|uniref:Autophagy-related protein 14 n=1 Tax=Pseudomassariella vexata TaxID=1141098 RepID=A0A1Y2DEV8_9PEZI|nr:UV radiation resistance protein and autophagy-related subunit 14-domain-containing protein [Pseudomassariella vexata]ORY57810.1 UV radiation resistance protein and autophagy-related subunit 14-domain-containing protein [Pseudomassariella vexata]
MSLSTESTRPLLLPQNRRLRHVQGIYLRNLSFARAQGKTTDDLELNKDSSGKLDEIKRTAHLHHAASTESLRQRPGKARRRSTTFASKSPITRQKQLELAVESRAADVFFSLHVADEDEPVYISEAGERSMNFDFRFFDLSQADPFISRSSQLVVKIWAKRLQEWSFLLEETVDLRHLNFLGTLRNQHFPPNCIVFHLIDGVYTLDLPGKFVGPRRAPILPTSSYNALMKLSNLDASIQDAIATRDSITDQINKILERAPTNTVPQAEQNAILAKKYVSAQQRAVKAAEAHRDQLKLSIAARRAAIAEGREAQKRAAEDVEHASNRLPASREAVASIRDQIRGQRRRICEDLERIFPITPSPTGVVLSFQICGITLPNIDYDPTAGRAVEDALSAGLGYVAQLTNALQYYLGVPLPYTITTFGSRSSIRDDISQIPDTQRTFPLFLRGGATAQYRFDYGWFLLNKDIEALCASAGLKVVDIRHTLPNLKYLLYVCSAGTDELPERKRGGVRGLWAGKLKSRVGSSITGIDDGASSTGGSRRGSADSEVLSRQRDELRRAIGAKSNGDGNHGATSVPSPKLPFQDGKTLSLRTKGLRENIFN